MEVKKSAWEKVYDKKHYSLSEIPHHYGKQVHILADPFSLTQLAKLCHPSTIQPQINTLVRQLYYYLVISVLNNEFPVKHKVTETRMIEKTERGMFSGLVLDDEVKIVCVDIARAGIVPSQICYDLLNGIFPPQNVRQDHLLMSRVTSESGKVVGASISGEKIGGPIEGSYVLFPDPMGATGNSLAAAMDFYLKNYGKPIKFITLNLIITPQFVRNILERHPGVEIYALRLDRGMSAPEIFSTELGERWEEEDGLTEEGYIVPGGGGFGEIMNNSFV